MASTPERTTREKPAVIFISYARRDGLPLALRLHKALSETAWIKEWQVFFDQQILAGESWTDVLDRAIDECDVCLALISSGSYASPICRAEHLRALRLGKRVMPLIVGGAFDSIPTYLEHLQFLDFSSDANFERSLEQLVDAITAGNRISVPAKYAITYSTAPELPLIRIARAQELTALRSMLAGEDSHLTAPVIAISGGAGVGKTFLVKMLCEDQLIRDAYPDGICWLTIGTDPGSLMPQLKEVARVIGITVPEEYQADEKAMENYLRTKLKSKAALIVLDDVWDARSVQPFVVAGGNTKTLFVARDSMVALSLAIKPMAIQVFHRSESIQFLQAWSGRDDPGFGDIADSLENLPFGLAVAGPELLGGTRASDWIREFRDALLNIPISQPDRVRQSLEACIDITTKRLPESEQNLYFSLGIFPASQYIPTVVIGRLWRKLFDFNEPLFKLLRRLQDLNLVEWDRERGIRLHSLLREYARAKRKDRCGSDNATFLESYRTSSESWASIDDDEYIHGQLLYHLLETGRGLEGVKEVLLDLAWLQKRLDSSGIATLVSDFDGLPADPELGLLQETLRLSQHVLALYPSQLAEQLLGRLPSRLGKHIDFLLKRARRKKRQWLRPLAPTLARPGGPLLRVLGGEVSGIGAVAILGDGIRCASGSDDGTIRIWDLETGVDLDCLQMQGAGVKAIVPLGHERLLTGSDDGVLRIWNLRNRTIEATLTGHTGAIRAVAAIPATEVAISASDDGTLRLWDLRQGQARAVLEGHEAAVRTVAVSPSGGEATSGSDDGTLRIWDLCDPHLVRILIVPDTAIRQVVYLDNNRFVSGGWDGKLRVWSGSRDAPNRILEGHKNGVSSIAVAGPDCIVSGSGDDTVRVWDLGTQEQTAPPLVGHTAWVRSVAVTTDHRKVISSSDDGTVRVWDLSRSRAARVPQAHHDWVTSLAMVDQGKTCLSASMDKTLRLWDTRTGATLKTLTGHSQRVNSVVVTEDSRTAVSCSDDCSLKFWDLTGKRPVETLYEHSDHVNSLSCDEQKRWVLSGSTDHTLVVWDLKNRRKLRTLTGHAARVRAVAFSGKGDRAVSASSDGTLIVWDLNHEQPACVLRGPAHSPVKSLARLPGGERVLAGSDDGTLTVWDMDTLVQVWQWRGHVKRVDSVSASRDGIHVVSVSSDTTAKVWRLPVSTSGNPTMVAIFAADGPLFACSIGDDQKTIAIGEAAGAVHFLEFRHR